MQLHNNVEHQGGNVIIIKTICLNSIQKLKEAEKKHSKNMDST